MNQRFLLAPQPTMKRIADLEGPDFYPTPKWATHALFQVEKFDGEVWECACGDGAMAQVANEYCESVYSSDLYDRGYGEAGTDFMLSDRRADNIVTNPPFHSAEDFVHKAQASVRKKTALLLRLAFLEGAKRQNSIFKIYPPARVWVFSERITFYPAGASRKGSGTTAYAWFVWDRASDGETKLDWLPSGLKAKFS
ncbi:hypothetical protein [uncultured Thioclava sp.]|uniref:hypothetical protein n=1 Tax=uncultured Thioclava sp. TaxID=473858 RepID=UPI0025D10E6D|nr:hypothetical protein [uncultured Thioclava sp.]